MRIYTKAELVVKTDDDQFADLYGVSVIGNFSILRKFSHQSLLSNPVVSLILFFSLFFSFPTCFYLYSIFVCSCLPSPDNLLKHQTSIQADLSSLQSWRTHQYREVRGSGLWAMLRSRPLSLMFILTTARPEWSTAVVPDSRCCWCQLSYAIKK